MDEFFLGVWACIICSVVAWGLTDSTWRSSTIERGLGQYCPADGEWAWKGECK